MVVNLVFAGADDLLAVAIDSRGLQLAHVGCAPPSGHASRSRRCSVSAVFLPKR